MNHANSCFMNACFQVLLHTAALVEVLLDSPAMLPCTGLFSGALRRLAQAAYSGLQAVRPPQDFFTHLQRINPE